MLTVNLIFVWIKATFQWVRVWVIIALMLA